MPNPARLLPALLLAATLSPRAIAEESPSDLLARYQAVHDATNLNDPALKPWHMRVAFDLLDPKGNATEHGTLEEWWAAPSRWHQLIISPSSNEDTYRTGQQLFADATGHLTYLVGLLAPQLLEPISRDPSSTAFNITLKRQSFGQVQLDCLLLQPIKKAASPPIFGVVPTYCIEPQKPNLRFVMEYGVQQFTRNRQATFQGKSVPLLVTIEEAGHPVLRATVDQLTGGSVSDTDLTPPLNMPARTLVARVNSGVISGSKIGGDQPRYPAEAKYRRISGTVLLHAIISKDGHITSLEPIYSPDASLTQAAITGVRTWTYKPYMLDGQPTEVETTITVNFNIGS